MRLSFFLKAADDTIAVRAFLIPVDFFDCHGVVRALDITNSDHGLLQAE
jgi:hypothetical protein